MNNAKINAMIMASAYSRIIDLFVFSFSFFFKMQIYLRKYFWFDWKCHNKPWDKALFSYVKIYFKKYKSLVHNQRHKIHNPYQFKTQACFSGKAIMINSSLPPVGHRHAVTEKQKFKLWPWGNGSLPQNPNSWSSDLIVETFARVFTKILPKN